MLKIKSVNYPVDDSGGSRILVIQYLVRFRKHEPPFTVEWSRAAASSKELVREHISMGALMCGSVCPH